MVKVLSSPHLAICILNAQLQLGWRADVPISVRLQGSVSVPAHGKISFGKGVVLRGTIPIELISHDGATIKIGDHCFINFGCSISAHQKVEIGNRCKLGHYVFIMDNNQHDTKYRTVLPSSEPVVIEDDVWIGSHSIILPGVRIGRNAIVGAGSVVTKDVPADTIYAGNPARFVREV